MFTHLHLHTEYSLLDGLIRVKPLVKRLKELGMTSCAMTDHGVMYGLYEFWSECKANGIKPIIGCEVYVAARSRHDKDPKLDKKRYHLTLLAKNLEGYHNLLKICSVGQLEGMYYKPRVDREILAKYSKGIIVTTGCLSSPMNKNLLHGDREAAEDWVKFFIDNFEHVFVELQRNGVEESEKLIPTQIEIAKKYNLEMVATCDSHYINKADSDLQEINWCIRDANLLSDPERAKKWGDEFYVKSNEEMVELFKDIPEAITNTEKVANLVEAYSIKYDRVQPIFPGIEDGESAKTYLRKLCLYGSLLKFGKGEAREKLLKFLNLTVEEDNVKTIHIKLGDALKYFKENPNLESDIPEHILKQINYELEIIDTKGYNDYFLIVSDFLNWAKLNGIVAGVRGSVGGSLVAFVTSITDIDPLKWELYFERFLNPQRPSPPDIDCDLQDDRRDEVVNYIGNKYGFDHLSAICALGRMKSRAAIRDVARVMGIDLAMADKLSKLVIVKFGKPYSIKDMMEKVKEFSDIVNSDPQLKKLIEVVSKIENMPRHASTHACGILITPKPVNEYVPLQYDKEGRIISQLEMKPLEELGLMKFDILGLANLTIIKNTLIAIEKYEGKHIDIWKIPEDDKATFDLLKRGDTTAVFQLESDGMKKYLRDLQPESLEDICFMCAAYRPGPMQFIPAYIDCKHGRKEPDYLIPELEPIVKNTYGFAIYQEQVIRIAVDIAGYTMGEADILRRAMGKKVKEIMIAEKAKFLEGCVKRGHTNEVAEKLFEYLMPFADYGFNKAHAAGYAMIAYQTAYLKAHYPIEFTIGLLESDLETADKLHRDVEEARNLGIEVLQPDVNKSKLMFGIEEKEGKNCIRFGMGGIKTINRKVVEKIITERDKKGPFKHFDDLVGRVGIGDLTKKTLEVLIETGALDAFGSRTQLLTIMPTVWNKYTRLKDERNQESLFGDSKVMGESASLLPNIEKETDKQKLVWERELLGTFFSNHPLRNYTYLIDNEKILSINKALEGELNKPVLLLVILKETKKIISKKNGKPMAFLKLEDLETVMDSVLFNTTYEKYKDKLKDGEIYLISGKINERNDQKSLLIDSIEPINDHTEVLTKLENSPVMKLENEPIKKKKPVSILIDVSNTEDKDLLKRLKESIKNNPGEKEVVLRFKDSNETIVEKTLSTKIKLTKEMIAEYGSLIH